MRRLRDLSLSIKLTLLILLVLGMFLIANIVLLVYSTQSFTAEIGNERIEDAVTSVQSSLSDIQAQLTTDINVLTSDIAFFQAVGRRDATRIGEIIAQNSFDQTIYDIAVVDGDGNLLFSAGEHEIGSLSPQALTQGAQLVIEAHDGRLDIHISEAVPIISVTGNVLGALEITRHIDENFLQALIHEQRRVSIGLVYDGEFIAESSPMPAMTFMPDALTSDQITRTDLFTSSSIPYLGAYLPLVVDGNRTPATLLTVVELSELYGFQNSILGNTVIVFMLLVILTIGLIYLVLYQIVINPVNRLRGIAQEMTSGQYERRIPVGNRDELGQLALTFNTMASAVQQREDGLDAARKNAERSDQVKSAFLASMSHELRTPLNAVINFTKFVAKGDLGPVNDEQKETLYEVVDSAKHLLNLINDVLDMSKIESGSLNLFIANDIDISAIINQVISTGKTLIEDKSIIIQAQIDDNLPKIRGDRQRLTQILLNIMSNACKFTEEGSITVKARHNTDNIVVSIADTGPGIAPEDQPAVFEAFKQTITGLRKGGGTGLGMPITKSLVEAHGGHLELISQPNEGATFIITLPIASDTLVPTLSKQRNT